MKHPAPGVNGLRVTPPGVFPEAFSYRINGGAVQTLGVTLLNDNYNATAGAITPNDGFLGFTIPVAVTAGQTVTILPGSLTFGSNAAFNQPPAVFNGNVFLTTGTFIGLSAPASANAVPEPSAWALLGVGAAGLGITLRLRRRARRA